MTSVSITELATLVGGRYDGPSDRVITGETSLADADAGQLSFLGNPKYASQLADARAGALLVGDSLEGDDPRFIRVKDVYFALSQIIARWFADRPAPEGISGNAVVAPSAKLGRNVRIGPFVAIGDGVVIGDDVTIFANVTIEPGSAIGDGTTIYPNVSVYHGTRIGRRCVIHSGAGIGSAGAGLAQPGGVARNGPPTGITVDGEGGETGAGVTRSACQHGA